MLVGNYVQGAAHFFALTLFHFYYSYTDINECDDEVHDCLLSLASCKSTLGSFNRSCNHGYIGDGKTNCTEAPAKIIDNFRLCLFVLPRLQLALFSYKEISRFS